jgi:putative hemolysin
MDGLWFEIALIIVAILANAVFAGSEIALVAARVTRLGQMREKAVAGAATALRLKEAPDAFLATIQIAITLVGTLASAVGGAAAVEALTPWLAALALPGAVRWAEPVALGLVIVAITYFSLVVGELTPKALALRNPERIACAVAHPIMWLGRLSSWLVRILTLSTRGLLRVFGLGMSQESPFVSEEDVRYLLREGAAKGIFDKAEAELVHKVFEFGDTAVRQIMVPRPNILGLDILTPPEEVLTRAVEIGRSRIPVYSGSIDRPVGVILIKDLLRCAAMGEPPVLSRLAHALLFVPETARISVLLTEFQRTGQNLATVVDEYGAVVGLVTVEDLLEEIVGDIGDEREVADLQSITKLPDGSYVMDGTALVGDVRDRFNLPLEESPEYQTVAGFILHALRALPTPGASVIAGGYRWTVVDMAGPRILRIKAQPDTSRS